MNSRKNTEFDRTERWVVIVLSLWIGVGFFAALEGLIPRLPRFSVGPLYLIETAIPIAVYFANARFRAYIASIDPKHLTIFHLWRLLAGVSFVTYGARQLLPPAFVHNAGYGDIFVGLMVPVVLLLPRGSRKYIVFHAIGLADFVLAVGSGIALTVMHEPLMQNIKVYPIALIPLLGVPISGASHVMAIHAAWKQRSTAAAPASKTLSPISILALAVAAACAAPQKFVNVAAVRNAVNDSIHRDVEARHGVQRHIVSMGHTTNDSAVVYTQTSDTSPRSEETWIKGADGWQLRDAHVLVDTGTGSGQR